MEASCLLFQLRWLHDQTSQMPTSWAAGGVLAVCGTQAVFLFSGGFAGTHLMAWFVLILGSWDSWFSYIAMSFNLWVDLLIQSHSQDKNDSVSHHACCIFSVFFMAMVLLGSYCSRYVFRVIARQLPKVLFFWHMYGIMVRFRHQPFQVHTMGLASTSFSTVLNTFNTDCVKGIPYNPTFK